MKRILPAFLMAAVVHAALLTADTRWFAKNDPVAPRTQVITMQLVDRVPFCPPAIQPLPQAPPHLPAAPKQPAIQPASIAKRPAVVKQKPPVKKIPRPSPTTAEPELVKRLPDSPPMPPPAEAPMAPPVGSSGPTPVEATTAAAKRDVEPASDPTPAPEAAVVMATPRYSENPPPAYPALARKRRYQGTVMLEVFVQEDGRVGDLRIVASSTHTLLDRAAMQAVKRWRFEPGRQGKHTLAMWVRVPIRFHLQ